MKPLIFGIFGLISIVLLTCPGELRRHERFVIAYILQVTLFNPVLFTFAAFPVHLNTVTIFPLLVASLLSLKSRDLESLKPLFKALIVLAITFGVSGLVVGEGVNAASNAARLTFIPISVIAILPAWRITPLISGALAIGLTGRALILLTTSASSSFTISTRFFVSELGGPNSFGFLVALSIILILQISSSSSRMKWIHLCIVPMTVVMFLTFSRGAFISLVSGIAVMVLTSDTLFRRKALGIGAFCIMVWIIISIFPTVGARIGDLSLASSSGRSDIFLRALNGFSEHPLFGNGFGSFTNISQAGLTSAHNVYLQILFEFGIIGFVGVACAVWLLIHASMSKQSLPLLAALMIGSFTDNHFLVVQISWIFPIIIAFWLFIKAERNQLIQPSQVLRR